jgi:hypothetical protein
MPRLTNNQVITRALREINVINEVQSPTAEQGTQALERLNTLMEAWKEDSLDVGYFEQTSTADTCPIPDYAEGAVIHALAIECAPQYGATISGESATKAGYYMRLLRRKILVEGLDNTDMSHLPAGAGHVGSGYDITTDN